MREEGLCLHNGTIIGCYPAVCCQEQNESNVAIRTKKETGKFTNNEWQLDSGYWIEFFKHFQRIIMFSLQDEFQVKQIEDIILDRGGQWRIQFVLSLSEWAVGSKWKKIYIFHFLFFSHNTEEEIKWKKKNWWCKKYGVSIGYGYMGGQEGYGSNGKMKIELKWKIHKKIITKHKLYLNLIISLNKIKEY